MSAVQRTSLAYHLQRAVGVTRVARVTGLDRCGVEVACAIRPDGHVLQVSNGKGLDFGSAALGALSEAAEALWAAERPPPGLLHASFSELDGEGWPPDALLSPSVFWSPSVRCAWVQAQRRSRAAVWVPAQAVWCPPSGGQSLGPEVARWTSNGLGAHPRLGAALQHALCEAVERDTLTRTLPQGWTFEAVRKHRVLAPSPLVSALGDRGFDVATFNLTAAQLPVAGAVLIDREHGPVEVTAGYACRPRLSQAIEAAVLEAAQSRLTEIQGAREDVVLGRPGHAQIWQRWLQDAPARALPASAARSAPRFAGDYAWVELSRGQLPVHVVKVLTPGLGVSELLT